MSREKIKNLPFYVYRSQRGQKNAPPTGKGRGIVCLSSSRETIASRELTVVEKRGKREEGLIFLTACRPDVIKDITSGRKVMDRLQTQNELFVNDKEALRAG